MTDDDQAILQEIKARLPVLNRLAASSNLIEDAAGLGTTLTTNTTQTITSQKTLKGVALRVVDGTGTLIHSFGTAS